MDPNILREALDLSDEEKLELIGDLWDALMEYTSSLKKQVFKLFPLLI